MVWSDMNDRRIRFRIKRRTPEARAADEALKDSRSQESGKGAPSKPEKED
ncbi:MAG: hypothetical protein HOY79_43915 [Streptomyces sp.]|nr:hypothetical protein [Streptomyces sp.]